MLYRLVEFILFLLYIEADLSFGSLSVRQIIVRVPREKDIGLIFDLTISNSAAESKKETLDYFVRSDGLCTLNISKTQTLCGFSRIFGGDFGSIEPGKAEKISLIWPTVSLYNRVGYCPIVITSANLRNQETHLKQLLYFDTRFETLDPECRSLRKHKNFHSCNNWDKDYFRNCTPLNCEERYFGKRSFYNFKTEQCDPVPSCSRVSTFYDMHSNECSDKYNFVTEQDLKEIRCGKYENNVLELNPSCKIPVKSQEQKKEVVEQDSLEVKFKKDLELPKHRTLKEFQTCFEKDYLKKQMRKRSQNSFLDWFSPHKLIDWFMNWKGGEAMDTNDELVIKQKKAAKGYDNLDNTNDDIDVINDVTSEAYNAVDESFENNDFEVNDDTEEINENDGDENSLEEISFETVPKNVENPTDEAPQKVDSIPHKNAPADWVLTLLHGLFIVIATIGIYFLICFIIFLIVSWLVHRSHHKESRSSVSNTLTPRHSDDRFTVITKSSLLSQR